MSNLEENIGNLSNEEIVNSLLEGIKNDISLNSESTEGTDKETNCKNAR